MPKMRFVVQLLLVVAPEIEAHQPGAVGLEPSLGRSTLHKLPERGDRLMQPINITVFRMETTVIKAICCAMASTHLRVTKRGPARSCLCFCIVSDWMRNGNVMEYTKSNPEVNRLRLLSEIMLGATYLHEIGVIHGDLKGANSLVDDNGAARIVDFGLMTIPTDLSTIPLSATTVSSAGTVRWMSPELLFDQSEPPTRESDCYALGMIIYEVLTGRQPFRRLGPYAVVIAVQKGKRPSKPDNAESLGFSNTLWWWTRLCWSESPSAWPTAQQLFRYFQGASCTWVPPLEYPIPDVLSGGAGADLTSGDERSIMTSALTSRLFALMVGMLCVLLLPLT